MMDVETTFVADGEPSETVHPREGALDDPRCLPSFWLCSTPRRAMRGLMSRRRQARRRERKNPGPSGGLKAEIGILERYRLDGDGIAPLFSKGRSLGVTHQGQLDSDTAHQLLKSVPDLGPAGLPKVAAAPASSFGTPYWRDPTDA
jgi:hypothetical protein